MYDDFYSWLIPNLNEISSSLELQDEISERLSQIHPDLNWEIGPGNIKSNFFAFSPSLNSDILDLTNQLSHNAPSLDNWEFLNSKPRKKWLNRVIELSINDNNMSFNFDSWLYFLTSFKDGKFFDVNLVTLDNELNIDENLEFAADLFVEFELGELVYMNLIDRVNIFKSKDIESNTNKITDLYDHLQTVKK